LTKWLGGHGSAIGGILTDAGKFNWKGGRHSLFTEPDANYHGLKWAIDLPEPLAPIAFALRVRTVPLRNLGAAISPDNSWIFSRAFGNAAGENRAALGKRVKNRRTPEKSIPRFPGCAIPGLKDDSVVSRGQQIPQERGSAEWWFSASKGGL